MFFFKKGYLCVKSMSMAGLSQNNHILSESDFETLFNKYHNSFVRIANSYVHDFQVAEDITNESFAILLENSTGGGGNLRTENYAAYLYSTVKNRCLDHLKVRHSRIEIQKQLHLTRNRMQVYDMNSLNSSVPDRLFESELYELVRDCINGMPDLTKSVFVASRFEDKTYAEIAEELHIPQRQVTAHIQKALKILRVELKDYLPVAILLLLLDY